LDKIDVLSSCIFLALVETVQIHAMLLAAGQTLCLWPALWQVSEIMGYRRRISQGAQQTMGDRRRVNQKTEKQWETDDV
jgi:hypothetical protein